MVKVYYTDKSPVKENYLTVALLQNNIVGFQSGGELNPEQDLGNEKYRHMHVFRHVLTPIWGDKISNTTKGNTDKKEYTYKIPEKIKSVNAVLEDIEILAFVSETKKTIISGTKATIHYKN